MNTFESHSRDENKGENNLSKEDIASVVIQINDERLFADEDVEYFIIKHGGIRTFILKRKYIPVADENGGHSNVEIGEYIRQKLDEY